jgi:uncharacterized membrane protein YheB (UPF0754 family)
MQKFTYLCSDWLTEKAINELLISREFQKELQEKFETEFWELNDKKKNQVIWTQSLYESFSTLFSANFKSTIMKRAQEKITRIEMAMIGRQ